MGRDYKIILGFDAYQLFAALLSGDDQRVKEITDRIDKENAEKLRREYDSLSKEMSEEDFNIFKSIEEKYKRNISIQFVYSHTWSTKKYYDYFVDDESDSSFRIDIGRLSSGMYDLFIYWSDDSGYNSGKYNILKDVEPKFLIEYLNKLHE